MSEPDNHTLRLLKKLRDEVHDGFARVNKRMDDFEAKVDGRFDRLERKLESVKQAAFGESVLGRYAAAAVEERLLTLEEIMALRRS